MVSVILLISGASATDFKEVSYVERHVKCDSKQCCELSCGKKMAISKEISGEGMNILYGLCVGITSALFIWSRVRLKFRGATVWPIVGVLPSLLVHLGNLYDWFTHLFIVNGGTFRLPGPWKCWILTADPTNIDYLLKTKYHNFGKGDIFKESLRDMFGDSIIVQDGEDFKRLSASVGKAFCSPSFRDFVAATMPSVVQEKLLPIFTEACEKALVVDLQDVFRRFGCYNVCLFGTTVELDCLKPGLPEFPFLDAFDEALQSVLFRLVVPAFYWKVLRFFNVFSERRLLKAREFIYSFCAQVRQSRSKNEGYRDGEIASAFLRYEGQSGRFYSERREEELFVNLVLAGKDTIMAGLSWFFWVIASHPNVEAQILAELRVIVKERTSCDDNEEEICFSFDDVKRMEYLHAALTESLRLYPAVPIDYLRAVEDDVLPDGTPVEKGAQVLYSMYSSGRLQSVWGEDCLEFKPERWMKNGRYLRQSDLKFVAFNGGPRRCTGIEFAYWQMKWAAASIFIRYSIKIVEKHPVLPQYGFTLLMKYGLLATVHQREMVDAERTEAPLPY